MKKAIILAIIVSFAAQSIHGQNGLQNKAIGQFHLTDLNNKTWDLSKLKGKVIVINFWFIACDPCRREMPELNNLVSANVKNDIVFLALSPDDKKAIGTFLKKRKFDYNIIPSSLDYISSLNINSFPTHLVIDKQGIIREVFVGYRADIKEELQAKIDELVK